MAFVKVDGGRAALEHLRNQIAIGVRLFGGAIDFEHVAHGVVSGDAAARFHGYAGMAADHQTIQLDDRMRRTKCRVHIPVILADDGRLGAVAGIEFPRRLVGGGNGGQRLDFHHDQVGGIFGDIRSSSANTDRNRFADIANVIFG